MPAALLLPSGSRGNKFHGGCVKSRYENHSEAFMILEQNHDRVGKWQWHFEKLDLSLLLGSSGDLTLSILNTCMITMFSGYFLNLKSGCITMLHHQTDMYNEARLEHDLKAKISGGNVLFTFLACFPFLCSLCQHLVEQSSLWLRDEEGTVKLGSRWLSQR